MARRHKPKTPEIIAAERLARRRADFEAVGMDPDSATLPAFADVETERQGKRAANNRAWRSNVFRLLLERKTIDKGHYNAANQLAEDWAKWKGLDGKGERLSEMVDGGSGCAELVTDRMIRAGKDVAGVLMQLHPDHGVILSAFMVAAVEEDRPMAWRGIVERTLKVTARDKQVDVVVEALSALHCIYETPRRAAA